MLCIVGVLACFYHVCNMGMNEKNGDLLKLGHYNPRLRGRGHSVAMSLVFLSRSRVDLRSYKIAPVYLLKMGPLTSENKTELWDYKWSS